jgi:type IV secretory pathway VirB3-like protein
VGSFSQQMVYFVPNDKFGFTIVVVGAAAVAVAAVLVVIAAVLVVTADIINTTDPNQCQNKDSQLLP